MHLTRQTTYDDSPFQRRAYAATSAAVRLGLVKGPVTVKMPGGTLNIEVAKDFSLTMKGPVAEVARGAPSPSFVRTLR